MQVYINTDNNIKGREALAENFRGVVESTLNRFRDEITRVEVHVSDENSNKKDGPGEMRCMMEARIEGRPPLAVTHHADNLGLAVEGAADKLYRLIESTTGRLRAQKGRRTDPAPLEPPSQEE